MKKRWFVMSLLVLLLCAGVVSANAAEEDGFLWYIEDHGKLMISADNGASYAELPGLGEKQERTGEDFSCSTAVTALSMGGVEVTAWDKWGSEPSFRRSYSAAEVAAALASARSAPVRVLCGDGQGMTLGVRTVYTTESYVPTGDIMADWRYTQTHSQLVYTTDGVTWLEQPWPEGMSAAEEAWWDGTEFSIYDWGSYVRIGESTYSWVRVDRRATSSDGLHWSVREENKGSVAVYGWSRGTVLGAYRFELYNGEVYLTRRDGWGTGVLLPHMGEAMRERGTALASGMLGAWCGPGDTVRLAVYDDGGRRERDVTIDYPISSLDWCLENLSVPFREPENHVSNGDGSVRLATDNGFSSGLDCKLRELLRNDGSGWRRVGGVPFSAKFDLLPYNGKTFVVVDQLSGELYFSADGLNWTATDVVRPADWEPGTYNRIECATAWTGKSYLVGRKVWEYGHGPMSGLGGNWFEGNTKVYFLDENLRLTDTYDFGHLVEAVGSYDGSYYAKVSDSTGTNQLAGAEDRVEWDAGSTLYASKDGKTWEKLPDIYLDYDEVMITTKGGSGEGNLPTGDPAKPLRTVAQLDRWRFILYERMEGYFDVYLMRGNANDMAHLDLEEEIKNRWITPGELSAAYTTDGNVRLTVRDMSTPSMEYSVTYTPQELDAMRDQGEGDWTFRGNWSVEERRGNGADVALMRLINGELEVAYRNGSTGGKYMYLENVPWSNSVELLEYSGKDFMLLDKVDGKLYLSADGKTWREATGDWVVNKRVHNYWEYAFVWTGEHYLGVCMLADDIVGDGDKVVGHRQWAKESCEVACLDENLEYRRIANLDAVLCTTAVGCQDGICYVQLQDGRLLKSPNGGRGWLETDVTQVRECLRVLGK